MALEKYDLPHKPILPISEGGTGANNASGARTNLGLGSVATENIIPISKGGTGANTASQACANLGALPTTGGAMKGAINFKTGNQLGAHEHCRLYSDTDKSVYFHAYPTDFDKTEPTRLCLRVCDGNGFFHQLEINGNGDLKWKDTTVLNPIGTVITFAGNVTIPKGYLLCDGSAISRATYANLFNVIGTTYGSGDGTTTFNLPNLTDKFIQGSNTAGTAKEAGLPNITGELKTDYIGLIAANASGKDSLQYLSADVSTNMPWGGSSNVSRGIYFNASYSNSIYGNSDTVQPPALTMRYIIKY